MNSVKFENPPNICPPLGLYSHVAKVPQNCELFYISQLVSAEWFVEIDVVAAKCKNL